jgi:hypothetical protein
METSKLRATLDVRTLKLTVRDKVGRFTWETADDGPCDLGYRIGGVSYETSLARPELERRVLRTGSASYRVLFPQLNCFVGLALAQDREDELVITLGEADGGGRAVPMAGSYPRSFRTPVSADAYTFAPIGMGMLIPGDSKETIRTTYDADCLEPNDLRLTRYADIFRDGKPTYWWDVHDAVDMDVTKFAGWPTLNMFGAKAKKSAYLGIVPTRFDWHLGVEHDPGQPTRLRHFWVPSMQRLRYDREVRLRFLPGAGYLEAAKAYRQWIAERGGLKTLAEKAAELPQLNDTKGGVDVGIGFLAHDVRRKQYQVLRTFEEGIPLVQDFERRAGVKKAIVTVRGWQKWGHDHHYPSLLPPNADCGGFPGLQRLAQAVREMGYHFELAGDNYHDIACDSPDFSEAVLIRRADGSCNRYNMWASGMTSMLTLPWAYRFLRRNFELGKMDYPQTQGLLELIPFDYYWIGNWGGAGAEDYSPACPIDRTEHHKWVLRILSYIRSKGKVLEMEHSSEWCAPYLDRVKNRPPAMGRPNEDAVGKLIGVCLPLWSLVFRDSTVTRMLSMPWERAFLYGGHPSVGLPLREGFETSGQRDRLLLQTTLTEVIGFDEMTSHAYLNDAWTRERCEYASGVAVEVDYEARTYKVQGHPGFTGRETPVPAWQGEQGGELRGRRRLHA